MVTKDGSRPFEILYDNKIKKKDIGRNARGLYGSWLRKKIREILEMTSQTLEVLDEPCMYMHEWSLKLFDMFDLLAWLAFIICCTN